MGVRFQNDAQPAGQYFTVAAGQTNQNLGAVGGQGDFLDSFTVIAATTTPGAVTIKDGTTAIYTIPAGTATVLPYVSNIFVRAYSKTGAWNVTTGASVSVVASGQFS